MEATSPATDPGGSLQPVGGRAELGPDTWIHPGSWRGPDAWVLHTPLPIWGAADSGQVERAEMWLALGWALTFCLFQAQGMAHGPNCIGGLQHQLRGEVPQGPGGHLESRVKVGSGAPEVPPLLLPGLAGLVCVVGGHMQNPGIWAMHVHMHICGTQVSGTHKCTCMHTHIHTRPRCLGHIHTHSPGIRATCTWNPGIWDTPLCTHTRTHRTQV